MKVPSPLPLQNPWSPLGYQVVQVEEEHKPGRAEPKSLGAPRLPASPVGCRVVQVGDERIAPARRRWTLKNRPSIALPPRKTSSLLIWGPVVACGAFMAMLLFGFLASLSMWVEPQTRQVAWVQPPIADVPVEMAAVAERGPQQVLLPDNAANLPVRENAGTPALKIAQLPVAVIPAGPMPLENLVQLAAANNDATVPGANCQLDNGGDGQPAGDTFGTSVRFARNPAEAARLAGKDRKLAFILHVSGNFEDSRFT